MSLLDLAQKKGLISGNSLTPSSGSSSLLQKAQQSGITPNTPDPRDSIIQHQQTQSPSSKSNVNSFVSDPTVVQPPNRNQITSNIGTGLTNAFGGEGAAALNKGTQVGNTDIKNLLPGLANPHTYVQTIKDLGNIIKGLGGAAYSDATFIPQAVANLGVGLAKEAGGNALDLFTGKNSGPHSALAKGIDTAIANPDKTQGFSDLVEHTLNQIAPFLIAGQGVQDLPNDINKIPGVQTVNDVLADKFTNQIKNDWAKPTTFNKSIYNGAKEIFNNAKAQGNDIGEILTQNKLDPTNHIEQGNYSTSQTAENIRTDAGKMSKEVLRPSLQMADYGTPRTPVEEIINQTIKDIQNSKSTTVGDMETQIAKVKAEGVALAKKYPDGMSLTDMHDQKITYNQNGGFSPIKDPNVNNIASVNRAFGRTLDSNVIEKAPTDIPVKEFNTELQKQYQAADYLEALDGKKVPQSIASRIAKTGSKIAGAAVGHALGGGILADVGGYHIGGMVESLLENMPNPIKNTFLNNLKITNPEAFDVINEYLNNPPTFKALPAPGEGTVADPTINLPAKPESTINAEANANEAKSQNAPRTRIVKISGGNKNGPITQLFGGESNLSRSVKVRPMDIKK